MHTVRVFLAVIALLAIAGCGKSGLGPQVEACVARGVAYFKEMGSFPTLKSAPNAGRRAEDVARERCNRTITAF